MLELWKLGPPPMPPVALKSVVMGRLPAGDPDVGTTVKKLLTFPNVVTTPGVKLGSVPI